VEESVPKDESEFYGSEQWFRFPYHLAERLWKFETFGPLAVYLCLLRHAGKDGRCWPGKKLLCQETGLSKNSIRKALRKLEQLGLIRVRIRRDRSSMYYVKSTLPPLVSHPLGANVDEHTYERRRAPELD
jgi:DNA-binding transcriptional ArsR family regulator